MLEPTKDILSRVKFSTKDADKLAQALGVLKLSDE